MSDSSVSPEAVEVIENPDGTFKVMAGDQPVSSDLSDRAAAESHAKDVRKVLRRAAIAQGLRELADFLEDHPFLPLDYAFASAHISSVHNAMPVEDQKALLVTALELFGGTEPDFLSFTDDMLIARTFSGGVRFSLKFNRKQVCTPEIVDGDVVYRLPGASTDLKAAA